MGLLDNFEPQGFADRGGLLGRLLSLRPDLAQDQQDEDGSAQGQTIPALGHQPSDVSASRPATSAIGSALDDFYRQTILQAGKNITGYVSDAIHDPAYFAHAVGPSLPGLGPIAGQLPAVVRGAMGAVGLAGLGTRPNGDSAGNVNISPAGSPSSGNPYSVQSVPAPPISGPPPSLGSLIGEGAALPGLGVAAATLASRGSNGLLGGPPQPIAPVFPQPVPTSSEDDLQKALGPAWKRLQSFLDNTRDRGSGGGGGGGEDESEEEKKERCRKQEEAAIIECSKTPRDYNRNMLGPFRSKTPRTWNDCIKGFLSPDCGGNDSSAPENYYHPWSPRLKKGPGSRRKR